MDMSVDQPRQDQEAGMIDRTACGRRHALADRGDFLAADCDVAIRRTRALR